MVLLLLPVDRADTAVDKLRRQLFLRLWYLIGSVDSIGREIAITPVVLVETMSIKRMHTKDETRSFLFENDSVSYVDTANVSDCGSQFIKML